MTHSRDMSDLTKKLERPVIPKPTVPDELEKDVFTLTLFSKQMTGYFARLDQLESNLKAVYDVAWGQCSEALQAKLKSVPEFEKNDDKNDCVWLLLEIRGVMLEFENERNLNLSLSDAHRVFELFQQGKLTLPIYLEQYHHSLIRTIEHYGGSIGNDPGLLKLCDQSKSESEQKKEAKEKYLGILFKKANRTQFGAL